jgi:hypothetical protein
MKRLCLSAVIELPDNPFEAASVYATVKMPWEALLRDLNERDIKFDAKADEMEVRKPVVRRPRKPRLVTPPAGEAA